MIYNLLSALNADIDIDVNKCGTLVVEVAFLMCAMLNLIKKNNTTVF